ncbi:MAG: hypothetical protein IKU20_08865 [Lachnospiraceae bacterium]|nr:hypothetical protein [Lachnospiraceae bacterium]
MIDVLQVLFAWMPPTVRAIVFAGIAVFVLSVFVGLVLKIISLFRG